MMKANKQIGFININEESIDKIIQDGEVVFEKGFLRERTSTTLPITFGGVGKDLKDYKVYGNTYQNSTTGKNLLNVPSTYTVERTNIDFSLQPGTYIVSCENSENYKRLLFFRWKENTNNGDYVYIEPNTTSTEFTITKKVSKLNFYSRDGSSASTGNTSTYINLMIRDSSISDDTYEPYTKGAAPNSDFPMEIVSCGDKTRNSFLAPTTSSSIYQCTYSKINNNSFSLNYNQETSDSNTSYARIDFDITQFKPNTQYTISKKHNVEGVSFNKAGSLRTYINGSNGNVVTSDSLTFTTPNEITSLGMYFYLGYNNSTTGESTVTFYDIQIEEGSATSYEPYGKYKIPVNVRSDNLISTYSNDWEQGTISTSNGTNSDSTTRIRTKNYYEIENDKNYYVSVESDDYLLQNLYLYDSNNNFLVAYSNVDQSFSGKKEKRINISSLTTPNAKYCKLVVRKPNNLTIDSNEIPTIKPMIKQGTTKTKFVEYYNQTTSIYLDEPLRKIGNNSDYIDFKNGRVVRNIYNINSYNSELITTDYMSSTGQLTIGTNVIYVLTTAVEESIELPNILTINGNNTLNIETEIAPSQVYIKYKSNT